VLSAGLQAADLSTSLPSSVDDAAGGDGGEGGGGGSLIGPPPTPPLTRNLSAGYITSYYFWLLLWPVNLSPDYSFAAFPLGK
jgi:hypothetical protein